MRGMHGAARRQPAIDFWRPMGRSASRPTASGADRPPHEVRSRPARARAMGVDSAIGGWENLGQSSLPEAE